MTTRARRQTAPAPNEAAAAAYTRVSTTEQAQEGVSLAAQEERIRAYCTAAGLELVQVLREEGVSGAKPLGGRPRGQTLAGLVRDGRVKHVVALKLDRLFRDAADALAQTRMWDQADVALHLIDLGGQAINSRSAMGRMFLTLTAAFAELERNLIAERTRAALDHKRAHRRVYSPTPLGFTRDGDQLIEDRDEQALVMRIRGMRVSGATYGTIARTLNAEGVPTKRGATWHRSTIAYLLGNSLYDEARSA